MKEGSAAHRDLAKGAAQIQETETKGRKGYTIAMALLGLAALLLGPYLLGDLPL